MFRTVQNCWHVQICAELLACADLCRTAGMCRSVQNCWHVQNCAELLARSELCRTAGTFRTVQNCWHVQNCAELLLFEPFSFLFTQNSPNVLLAEDVVWLQVADSGLCSLYRVIHKSLRDFQPLRYSIQDGHAEGEHVNRGKDTPGFCPTVQVLDMSILGDAADVNPAIKFLPHPVNHVE
jgi:hypothetical protein